MSKPKLIILVGLLAFLPLSAQWQEVQFDDSDMALDLTEAFTFQKYPTYDQYLQMMEHFASTYPSICRLDTLGRSEEGRLLLALKISDFVEMEEAEANFLYTSSMHGDELVGIVLLLRLADHLLAGYGVDTEVTTLVDNLAIWINPLANPDGSYSADENSSLKNATRETVKGIDLNRNFPVPGESTYDDTTGMALENKQMMEFLINRRFSMSANIHAGAEVVNYPWDHTSIPHADNDWFQFISREYADEAMAVDPDYMFGWPDNGITNGAAWYVVEDGRQDYVTYYLGGREITLELSNEKQLGSDLLEDHWVKNQRSLLNYMAQCLYGIRGFVTDKENGAPIGATIRIPAQNSSYPVVYSTDIHGDYYRLIKEGTYDLVVSAPGYLTDTILSVTSTDYQATRVDIQLEKDPTLEVPTQEPAHGFRVYPNPAREQIFLSFDPLKPGQSIHDRVEIGIYSTDGVLQLRKHISYWDTPITISTEKLSGGIYILKITNSFRSGSIRFIVQ